MIQRASAAAWAFLAGALLLGCISTARKSMSPEEAHYGRTVPHQLERGVAFARVELALAESYDDLNEVLRAKKPDSGTFELEPVVTYKVGGPMGKVQHARYRLQIVVRDATIDLAFDLGPDVSGGGWAPTSEMPYIHGSFDQVAANVEQAVAGE